MECPKAVAKFDDPIEFKRKWRQFFAELKASSEVMLIETPEMKRVRDQYAHMPYPEDVPRRNSIEFLNEFKDFQPDCGDFEDGPGEEEPWEAPELSKVRRIRNPFPNATLTEADSQKFGGDML